MSSSAEPSGRPGVTRVLCVDDSAFDRDLVRDSLEHAQRPFSLELASSRESFEQKLASGGFDLVLSDFNILGFDGLDVIEMVRSKAPGLPVIIVTGTGSEEVAVEAMRKGAADYVIKTPRHIRKLPETIEAVLLRGKLERDREALLREVHHRVKNNFQIIISMLAIQTERLEDAEARRALVEIEDKTRAMAYAYEHAAASPDFSSVPLRDYLANLVSAFRRETLGGRRIAVSFEAEDCRVDIALALPCGLLVSELLTNCSKYAFPATFLGDPTVAIALRSEDGCFHLTVSDNGVGLPQGFDWLAAKTLGLKLLRLMVEEQLGGTVALVDAAKPDARGGPGVCFDICLPRDQE